MILRICVVIPTFNQARTICETVNDVLRETSFPVLIIDDGSETLVSNALYSWDVREALERGRVWVQRFDRRRGKGQSLQFAIRELVDRGFTHMFTLDGDGQYFAREMAALVELAKKHPWDLIMGMRKRRPVHVPASSRIGRAVNDFWVNYQTGLQIKDSLCGFRIYPLLAVQTMEFWTSHVDFDIEVLSRLVWSGTQVREVEIEAFHSEPEARGRWETLWTGVRTSSWNAWLVTVSLLKNHESPIELSLALGLGVFAGCTPFYGFHTVIVIALAFMFRLNVIFLWIGTHVSTPIFLPLLIYAEERIGQNWLHVAPEGGLKGDFYQILAGSMVLGLMLGLFTIVVSFLIARNLKNRKGSDDWRSLPGGGPLAQSILRLVLRRTRLEWGYALAALLVPYCYVLAPRARRGLDQFWRLLKPTDSWWVRQKQILKHFYRFTQVQVDRCYFRLGKRSAFAVSDEGGALAGGAQILLSLHLGALDLVLELLDVRVATTWQPGERMKIMADRGSGDHLELLPLLGRLVPIDLNAFYLAATARIPVVMAAGCKGSTNGQYRFFTGRPRVYEFTGTAPHELQSYEWAQDFLRDIEALLREFPDQWFNFYPYWSTLPFAPEAEVKTLNVLLEDLCPPPRLTPEPPL